MYGGVKFKGSKLLNNLQETLKKCNHLLLFNIKLEVRGRVRREAAQRRKSEWEVNLGSRNSSRWNGSWQMTPKTVS